LISPDLSVICNYAVRLFESVEHLALVESFNVHGVLQKNTKNSKLKNRFISLELIIHNIAGLRRACRDVPYNVAPPYYK